MLQLKYTILPLFALIIKIKTFYTEILGLEVLQEIYREERDSYKLDLA
jgi:glyoxylase I family protein